MKKLQAEFDSIIVEPIKENKDNKKSIIVPDAGKSKEIRGKIISIGKGKFSVTGQFIPTTLKVGDEVVLPNMGVTRIEWDGKEYYGCPETMVISTLVEN